MSELYVYLKDLADVLTGQLSVCVKAIGQCLRLKRETLHPIGVSSQIKLPFCYGHEIVICSIFYNFNFLFMYIYIFIINFNVAPKSRSYVRDVKIKVICDFFFRRIFIRAYRYFFKFYRL